MEAVVLELFAYSVIVPLRIVGLLGGRHIRKRTKQGEDWLLRLVWRAAGTNIANNLWAGSPDVLESADALARVSQAKIDAERAAVTTQRGPKRVEGADAEASRSEQLKDAMLEAQRLRRAREQRSSRNLRRRLP